MAVATWSAIASGVTVAAAVDLLRITVPTQYAFMRIKRVTLTADATSTAAPVIGLYKASTAGTGGTTVTPLSLSDSSTASGVGLSAASGLSGATTKPDGPIWRETAYLASGWEFEPEGEVQLFPGQHFVVRTETAITSVALSCSVEFELVG